jgi:capsular exopolysaccharide synthesis family protein
MKGASFMKEDIIMIHKDPKSPIREAYRTLRTNIQFSGIDKTLKSLVITSSIAEEGKTTISINLAYSIAQIDKKVILIDSDLRKPKVHKVLDIPNESGLTTVLTENLDYKIFVQTIDGEKLDVLTSGPMPPNPSELLGSKRMQLFLEKIKEDYDMIILDTPPAGLVTDAVVLSTIVDGTIIVCAAGTTEIDAIKATKAALDKVNANIIGVIMNKVPIKKGEYYTY